MTLGVVVPAERFCMGLAGRYVDEASQYRVHRYRMANTVQPIHAIGAHRPYGEESNPWVVISNQCRGVCLGCRWIVLAQRQ